VGQLVQRLDTERYTALLVQWYTETGQDYMVMKLVKGRLASHSFQLAEAPPFSTADEI
jgi:hypothetical protein